MKDKSFISAISNKEFQIKDRVEAFHIRKPIFDLIKSEHETFSINSLISNSEYTLYRAKYIDSLLSDDENEITDLEKKVLDSLKDNKNLSIIEEDSIKNTFGQKIADKVAEFGGSWTFILSFLSFLIVWIIINAFFLINKGFDPYPFILLNLILSCVAALQAPVIMMSQNRQEEKDRKRAESDFMINLKSELEIRILHEKIDHLMLHQEQAMLKIQREQINMLNDILLKLEKK